MKFQRTPLQLTLLYLLFATLWILLSDCLLLWLALDGKLRTGLEVLKGLVFVLITAALLYCALSQYQQEQRRVQARIRRSEERLAQALDAAQEGMWDWDLKSARVFFSKRYC